MIDRSEMESKIVESSDNVCTKSTSTETEISDPKAMFVKLHKKAMEMGLTQGDLCLLEFVKDAKMVKEKEFFSKVFQGILASSSFLVVCVLLWNLDWPISKQNVAQIIWKIRGKGPVDFQKESCLYAASDYIYPLTRPLLDCDFCENVTSVERVSHITVSEFEEKYAYTSRPVIIEDGASNWSAVKAFTFDFFKDIYRPGSPVLEQKCQFFRYDSDFETLSDVFLMDKDRLSVKDGLRPWYIGWSNCDVSAATKLRQHYSRPYFLPAHSESSTTDWIFMGSPGYGAHMHIDNVYLPSWQAQITGQKTWILESPPECMLKCVARMTVTVNPGEIIVVDTNKWFHSTKVTGDDISITIGSEYD